jgi:small subunit ribosomal protein S1
VKVGDEVKVYVLSIDQKKERIALSIKQLEPDPWEMVEEHYHIGQLVEASITKLTKFGAFARLNDDFELEGLIHISELSEEHIEHPSQIVKSTDIVSVRIIRIDADQRQLGLSLKQVSSAKFLEMDMALATDFSMEEEE